jgi:hypothetical protein
MKVQNMTSPRTGKPVANQFIIETIENITEYGDTWPIEVEYFQSYDSIIAVKRHGKVELDRTYWDYSTTTGKYRNQFLGETKKETQAKIDSGEYILTDLNG